ncbi:MAG: alkaline phosphatase family protein [Actinobacteria bacterium]|nr:alkaline phosphatase family protein [Actinomycetota bacterium]
MSKVCVIGLDGGTFAVIDYLIGQKQLPNFARLMADGSHGNLLSTTPPLTPAAWSSFFTGSNPGKTGAIGFFKFRAGTYQLEPMNAGNLQGTPIWSLASSHGKRVCVFNVPVTYPAKPVNGILISGMDAPSFDDQAIYPLEKKESFLAAVPNFKISTEIDIKYLANHSPQPAADYIEMLTSHLDMEIKAINHLMGLEDWDLFVGVIRSTDSFQHIFWKDTEKVIKGEPVSPEEAQRAEAVFNCYKVIDRELGKTWSSWSADRNLIFMSDHGFGKLRSDICLNRVLEDAGLLKFLPGSRRNRSRDYFKKVLQDRMTVETRKKIKRLLGKDNTDKRWHLFVDSLVADIDWSRTRISSIAQHGCLFVNLKGRDPMGIVAGEAERQAVLSEAEAALSQLVDPEDGVPVVSDFYRKEELYNGPLMKTMPDMVVNMRNWSYRGITSTAIELAEKSIFRSQATEWKQLGHTGTHRLEGMLIMGGPDIADGEIGTVQMVDVAPTIMRLMGLPSLREWDGHALEQALDMDAPDLAAENEFIQADVKAGDDQVYSQEDEEEIRKRLENLGYL